MMLKVEEDTSLVSVDVTDREVILVDDVNFIQVVPSVLAIDNIVGHGRPARESCGAS